MIRVNVSDKTTLIQANVTDFSDAMGYCEHKIPFYLEGIKAPPSKETLLGTQAHEEEEEFEKQHFEFKPISAEELSDMTKDLEFAREGIYTRFYHKWKTNNGNIGILLNGRADKILRNKQTLIVQDDKFPYSLEKYDSKFEPYDDQMLQALTYLNSMYTEDGSFNPDDWFPIPHKEKVWIIRIRDRKNNNKPYKIFKGIQNVEAVEYLKNNIERFARLVLELEERQHHNIADKCKPCRYFSECKFRLE